MGGPRGHNQPPQDGPIGGRSLEAYERARSVFPDGTTRVTIERDPTPRYISSGAGAYLFDVDGRRFLDLNGNFTTLIHGHAFAPVVAAVERQIRSGSCFANPTEHEIALAELIVGRVPRLEAIRFVNTGTEAVLFAIKAARAYTGRPGIAKLEGAYHGAYDWGEVSQVSDPGNWGDADEPASTPFYAGMPQSVLDEVVTLRFNDAANARRRIAEHAGRLAAVLLDPMPSRAGLIPPAPDFIEAVEDTCRRHGILVISDEVLSLRQGYHGASARYGLSPDLFALGKIIGGGLPIGAVGGRAEVMAVFDGSAKRPLLPQGGTFSANPLSMVAGLASMRALDEAAFAHLEALGERLRGGVTRAIGRHGAPFSVTGAASLLRIHPKRTPPRDFREAWCDAAETARLKALGRAFARAGVIYPAAASACLSTPMTEADIDDVIAAFDDFLATEAISAAEPE